MKLVIIKIIINNYKLLQLNCTKYNNVILLNQSNLTMIIIVEYLIEKQRKY